MVRKQPEKKAPCVSFRRRSRRLVPEINAACRMLHANCLRWLGTRRPAPVPITCCERQETRGRPLRLGRFSDQLKLSERGRLSSRLLTDFL